MKNTINSYSWPGNVSTAVTSGPAADAARKWTSVLAKDACMKIHVSLLRGGSNRYKWLRYGITDITVGGIIEIGPMLEGTGRFADRDTGPFPIRAVWAAAKGNEGFFVRGDSHIKNIKDVVPGVRVADMSGYLATKRVLEALLAWSGKFNDLDQDVVWVPAKNSYHKVELIIEGKADIAFALPTSPEIYEAENNPFGIRWIDLNPDLDREGAQRFFEKHPLVDFGKMFNGVSSCIGHWGMIGTGLFCCHEEANVDFVYHLTKWMNENRTRYRDLHFRLEYMSLETLMEQLNTTFIPCHEGLIKYLKELELWTSCHEKRQQENVDTVSRYCDPNQKAMWLADEKGIVVSQDNPEWIELWDNYKKEHNLLPFHKLPSLVGTS